MNQPALAGIRLIGAAIPITLGRHQQNHPEP
jgi:hypothetical protein